MDGKAIRRIRKDLTILTSLVLLALVATAALTGAGMDDAEGHLAPVDDLHAAAGWALALVAGVHSLLHLGALWKYGRNRARSLGAALQDSTHTR